MHAPTIKRHVWKIQPDQITVTRHADGPGVPGTSHLLWQMLESEIQVGEDVYFYVGMLDAETWLWHKRDPATLEPNPENSSETSSESP